MHTVRVRAGLVLGLELVGSRVCTHGVHTAAVERRWQGARQHGRAHGVARTCTAKVETALEASTVREPSSEAQLMGMSTCRSA